MLVQRHASSSSKGDGYEVIVDVPPTRRDDFEGPAMPAQPQADVL